MMSNIRFPLNEKPKRKIVNPQSRLSGKFVAEDKRHRPRVDRGRWEQLMKL